MSETAEMYPLGRDEAESHRLNEQHRLLLDIADGPIDKSIPLNRLGAVADVGTGTGIWLWDAQTVLDKIDSTCERHFHGFDISAAQFPPTRPGERIKFSVHDLFKPFPAEHLNRYDLVHIRLLVTAFAESEFQKAVANLLTILKPGGYLQWVEIDFSHVEAAAANDARVADSARSWLELIELNKMSKCAPAALSRAYEEVGLQNIVYRSFLVSGRDALKVRAQAWQRQFFSTIMPLVLIRTGRVADSIGATQKASEMQVDLDRYFADGGVLDTRFGTVVGQKPE
ncbi:hypothetical protein BJX61DRAFT_533632 [Aspergillus egyptiacus]|nr:hypothetical protein BJX61DRAFT_533632 [Aspergillus egyptiacus]